MNKVELVRKASLVLGDNGVKVTQKDLSRYLDVFTDLIVDELVDGGEVRIVGFGAFKADEKPAHVGRNPQTGEAVDVPAHLVPRFKPSAAFKEALK